jgi:hypothetical protein
LWTCLPPLPWSMANSSHSAAAAAASLCTFQHWIHNRSLFQLSSSTSEDNTVIAALSLHHHLVL